MFRLLSLCLCMALLSAPSYAEDSANRIAVPMEAPEPSPPVPASGFLCTPGFALEKYDTGYRLSGKLETPTPGYSFEIIDVEDEEDGKVAGILRLTGPGGAVIQVIDSVTISHDLPREAELSRLTLTVEKQFNWGPSSITCSAVTPEE